MSKNWQTSTIMAPPGNPWVGVRNLFMNPTDPNSCLLYEVIMSTKRHGVVLGVRLHKMSRATAHYCL